MNEEDAKKKAAEFMVAVEHASMFAELHDYLATRTDETAQRLLSEFKGFLGNGYTGRVMAFKRMMAGIDAQQSGQLKPVGVVKYGSLTMTYPPTWRFEPSVWWEDIGEGTVLYMLVDDGNCRSCVDGKCVTGDECVTLGRDK